MDELSSRQQELFTILMEASPHSVSGRRLMRDMEISKEALRAQISRMRDKGVEIETLKVTYYRLRKP